MQTQASSVDEVHTCELAIHEEIKCFALGQASSQNTQLN